MCKSLGNDKGLKPTAKFMAPLTRQRLMNKTLKAIAELFSALSNVFDRTRQQAQQN
jgi:hypothetical protein